MSKSITFLAALLIAVRAFSSAVLIPMDHKQADHLKAYGVAYYTLSQDVDVDWLLNYRGGSFMIPYETWVTNECVVRGVSYELISDAQVNQLLNLVGSPTENMNLVKLEKEPRIAVYSPKNAMIEDESDAVIAVLEYAEIPFTILYDLEILSGELNKYDWLHLHHEDFTGQIHRHRFREESLKEAEMQIRQAANLGYSSVAHMKFDVTKEIRDFVASGKYLFAMCSGAETFDIALATDGQPLTWGDFEEPISYNSRIRLDYSKSFAFENFTPEFDWRFSNINENTIQFHNPDEDYFTLFTFSAKWDIVPTLLTQNHEHLIEEFFGLTTAFNKELVKPGALILAENARMNRVRYIYGVYGEGHWTYYSGHDPERPTQGGRRRGGSRRPLVELHPNSPGYRLILNNVLFPAAKKRKRKT
ncbi:MAG: asparagine synthetase B [Bacteroidota bacterium]